jgi:hypothetical protein
MTLITPEFAAALLRRGQPDPKRKDNKSFGNIKDELSPSERAKRAAQKVADDVRADWRKDKREQRDLPHRIKVQLYTGKIQRAGPGWTGKDTSKPPKRRNPASAQPGNSRQRRTTSHPWMMGRQRLIRQR